MNKITKHLVDEFLELSEEKSTKDDINFEKFANYTVIMNEYNSSFDLDSVSTGENQGIDGIGIIVNNNIVSNIEEIDDLIAVNKNLEVSFVFIQSKTSPSFEGSEIGNMFFTVIDLLSDNPKLPMTDECKKHYQLIQHIYSKATFFTKGRPMCKLYYVTCGSWKDDKSLVAVVNKNIQDLIDQNMFEDVVFRPCGENEIQKMYYRIKELSKTTFTFKDRVTLPDIEGIEEAFIGYVPFSDFIGIICDENNNMKNVFYDNVRGFLGSENKVNRKIESTIIEGKSSLFLVLNNGVTIVAESSKNVSNKIEISNYQIVNGCQTSHVIFENRHIDGIEKIYIPIRLIITSDNDIKSLITIATNSQTEIKPEQLASLSEFQKNLERFYSVIEGVVTLYYERTTNQYNSLGISRTKIITIQNQIKSFSSMFLNNPHLVSGYYGTVAKTLGDKIFNMEHKYMPYYTSGLAYYMLESFFRSNKIDSKFKKSRYHILMLYRMLVNGIELPYLNSKRMDEYCQVVFIDLNNSDSCLNHFKGAINILEESKIDYLDQKELYQKSCTDTLIRVLKESQVK